MEKSVGKVIRVEWDTETDEVRIVMNITDPHFKRRVIYDKDFEDILSVKGKDVIMVASRSNKSE